MSKEREMIEKLCSFQMTYSDWLLLIADAEELLAQPEQEPVGIVITIGGYPDNSEHTVKLTCRHRDLKDGDLLYTAPPKLEPLSNEEIWVGFPQGVHITTLAFYEGVKFAEKHHKIGS